VKHMVMTTVRGRFKDVQATLRGDRDHPDDAGVEVTINAASVDTGVADRDGHLRGADFFDAEKFRASPSAAHGSRGIRRSRRGTASAWLASS